MTGDRHEHDFDEELGMYWYGDPLPAKRTSTPKVVFRADVGPNQNPKKAVQTDWHLVGHRDHTAGHSQAGATKRAGDEGFWDLVNKLVQKKPLVKPTSQHDVDQGARVAGDAGTRSVAADWNLVANFSQLMVTSRREFMSRMPGEQPLSVDLCLEYLYLSAGNLATIDAERERLGERFYGWVLGDRNRIYAFTTSDIRRAELVDTFLLDLRNLQRLWKGGSQ